MTTVLNIDDPPNESELQAEKNESLATDTRDQDSDPEYEYSPDSQALAGIRILVVDDEPDCATLTGYLLS